MDTAMRHLCVLVLLAVSLLLPGSGAELLKGVSYGPVPLKSSVGASDVPADDWFCDEAAPMWGGEGRGDLAVMSRLGANMVRLYGNNPERDHTNFLDEAHARGLSVAPGMSDYPYYQQVPGSCLDATDFDCFTQVRPLYLQNLQRGFLDESKGYHPALKYMNIINEPDLKMPHTADTGGRDDVYSMCRAIISAFDGMLEAEKEAGVTGRLINFTATFSFALCSSCEYSHGRPALAQMAQLDDAMRYPAYYNYVPRNDITAAYLQRFTHSFNTANPAADVKIQFLDYYEQVFPTMPVYIAEYHRVGGNQTQDLDLILQIAEASPVLLGISFFQFQVAYWKTGSELAFGMFGLGDSVLATLPYFGKTYDVDCLTPQESPASGTTLPGALAHVYGGHDVDATTLCADHPGAVPLSEEGYLLIARQNSVPQMLLFVQRLIHHMGAVVKDGQEPALESVATDYSGDDGQDAFERMAGYLGGRPAWLDFDTEARCVANRNAIPSVVGSAIGWVCSEGGVDCSDIPPPCNGSTYALGDYVFSRFAAAVEGPWDPLASCAFQGAALFAPAETYAQYTLSSACVVAATTTTTSTTVTSTRSTTTTSTATSSTVTTSTNTKDFMFSQSHHLRPAAVGSLLGFLALAANWR